jgi:stage II sporulation protein P
MGVRTLTRRVRKKRKSGIGAFVLLVCAAVCVKALSSPGVVGRLKAIAFSEDKEVSSGGYPEAVQPSPDTEEHETAYFDPAEGSVAGSDATLYAIETTLLLEEDKPEPTQGFTDVSAFDPADFNIRNETSYAIDAAELLAQPLLISPDHSDDEPDVLIIHTHGCEAYAPTEQNMYEPSDPDRTEDRNFNVVRVGDEIERVLTQAGIKVVHERSLFDYPSYNGCYNRALERIEEILTEYPSIQIVLDIHRDALTGQDGMPYRSVTVVDGKECAQVLLVVGTGEGGLTHPYWKENLKLALQLERIMQVKYSGLTRRLNLRQQRFNQHATLGSLIVEIGCTGNTLEEALRTAGLFAQCAAEVILQAGQTGMP